MSARVVRTRGVAAFFRSMAASNARGSAPKRQTGRPPLWIRATTGSSAFGFVPPDLSEMKRKKDPNAQGAENQPKETRLEIDRHRMPPKQIDAYEQVERRPKEIRDGGGRAFAARIGERCRKDFAAQSASQMRDAIAEESPGKETSDIVHAITSEIDEARSFGEHGGTTAQNAANEL
jgi:hypothetical protein